MCLFHKYPLTTYPQPGAGCWGSVAWGPGPRKLMCEAVWSALRGSLSRSALCPEFCCWVFYFYFLTPAEKSWQIVNINSYWIGFVPRLLKKQFSMSAKPYMYPKSYRKKSEQVILWLSSHPGPRAASEGGFFSGGSFFSTTLQPSAAPVKFCFVRLK